MSHRVADSQKLFMRYTKELPNPKQIELFDYIAELRESLKSMTDLNLRLTKLIPSASNISSSLVLDDVINTIINEACENLQCDRASVFLVDKANGELWTKAKGIDDVIRIDISKGIVGAVATSGLAENIEDAY